MSMCGSFLLDKVGGSSTVSSVLVKKKDSVAGAIAVGMFENKQDKKWQSRSIQEV